MDPNACLNTLRAMVAYQLNGPFEGGKAYEMAEAFDTLDLWIKNGGFLPTDWQK